MRAAFSFIGILIVLGIGYFIYTAQIKSCPEGDSLPRQSNLIAVRQDLLSLGQAEKLYRATNGSYAAIDQLRNAGVVSIIPDGYRWGYEYGAEEYGTDYFRITAIPIDRSLNLPTLSIDETLQISP